MCDENNGNYPGVDKDRQHVNISACMYLYVIVCVSCLAQDRLVMHGTN